ncbi:hypothetical protein [Actinoplanes solisilvae]|uniref:hypothetical protein n=1 Tax=Actinoplanes solisilvae TaxID=2486853 RepID=UPI000FDA7B6E|nr:hypothetical protein [Actinoplanes solisilvae]
MDATLRYRVFVELTDVVDGFPYDHGPAAAAEMIAQREIRDAAWDWLSGPRTGENMWSYLSRWENRIAALSDPPGPMTNGSMG